jgi:hypothetical protein
MIEAVRPLHPDDSIRTPLSADIELMASCAVDALSRRCTAEQSAGFEQLGSQLCSVVRNLDTKRLQIVRDPNLTTLGKRAALMKAAQSAHEAIRTMRANSTGYASHLQQIEESLSRDQAASRSTEDRIVSYLREREVRDLLRQMDAIEANRLYVQAAQDGNDLLCAAVEQDPLGRLVLRESIDANKRTRLLSRDPERAQLHGQLSELAQAWEGLLTEAERAVGASIDNVLEDIAGGAG